MTSPAAIRPRLAVQDRQRLFREALCVTLQQYLPDIDVVEGVESAPELLDLVLSTSIAYVVLEAGTVPWDPRRLIATIRSARPATEILGLAHSKRQVGSLGIALVPRTASPSRIADLVQPGSERPTPFMLTASSGSGRKALSEQQLRVLSLLSLGLTTAQVASRLGVSERGVAKSKRVLFTKLGVQSQAEALSRALEAGLLGPSRREATL